MDEATVQWKKERFDKLSQLRPFLKSCSFVIKREVKFIPSQSLGEPYQDEVDPAIYSWWKG
jgi:peptide chain release factor subunit 3